MVLTWQGRCQWPADSVSFSGYNLPWFRITSISIPNPPQFLYTPIYVNEFHTEFLREAQDLLILPESARSTVRFLSSVPFSFSFLFQQCVCFLDSFPFWFEQYVLCWGSFNLGKLRNWMRRNCGYKFLYFSI